MSARRLKVEMIIPALPAAGMETMVADLVVGLGEHGHDVGVTCIIEEGALAPRLRERGHRVSVVPTPGLRTNLQPTALAASLRERQPDVVHVHDGAWMKGARAARQAGVPRVVATMHGINSPEPWQVDVIRRFAIPLFDAVVPVSDNLVGYLGKLGARPEQLRMINNGVDTARFAPDPAGPPRRGAGEFLIGTVARLEPVKNQSLLLDAFALLRRDFPGARLELVGDGSLRGRLEQQARDLGIADHVLFAGIQSDTPAAYRRFDVFTLPSVLEGTSISILEAMASGVPVVATAVGGNTPLLGHGDYGLLVPLGDPPALAAAFAALLADPARRTELAARGRARVCAEYSRDASVAGHESLYYDGLRLN